MAILFADDFKGYGTDNTLLLNGLWGTAGFDLVEDPDPNVSGAVAWFRNFGNQGRRPFAKGALAVAGVACRIWLPELPFATGSAIRFLDGGSGPNAIKANFGFTPTGQVFVATGLSSTPGNIVETTDVPVTTANAWNHFEMKVVVDDLAGSIEVRVNGVQVILAEGIDTGSALQLGISTVPEGGAGANAFNMYVKDLVCWDGTGTYNNDFLGSVSVISMEPNSDVAFPWEPSEGTTGYNLLTNSPPLDTTQFITANYPAPGPAVFGLSDLPINVTSVRALVSQVRARNIDGGDGNLQASMISGGSTVGGSDRPMTTAFTYYEDVFETDPSTGVQWTPAGTDDAHLQLNRTL